MSSSRIPRPPQSIRRLPRVPVTVIVTILLGTAIFSASSAHQEHRGRTDSISSTHANAPISKNKASTNKAPSEIAGKIGPTLISTLLPQGPPDPEIIETFAADCTTPKTSFNFGDVACAKVSGGPPLSLYPRRIAWVDTDNNILQRVDVLTDPQTNLFTIPAVNTDTDYRGVWRVNDISNRSSVRTSAFFTVSNPAQRAADLLIYNGNDSLGSITGGSNIEYVLWLSNKGPDAATDVEVINAIPASTSFVLGDLNDPAWNCTFPQAGSTSGGTSCTIASLSPGATAKIRLVYNVISGTPVGTTIENTAHISSETADPHDDTNTPPPSEPTADPSNNTATSRVVIIAGAPENNCTLDCPANITATANATQEGQGGAFVSYSAATGDGTCGAITNDPVSGSFFAIGEHTVTSSSESGASCSFTVTVVDTTAPTISCPPGITVNESSAGSGFAIVNYNVTATDNSGTTTVNCTPASGSSFTVADSPHAVHCTATDPSDNSSSCDFNVTVSAANEACTLTPPSSPVVVESPANACGANVNFTVDTSGTCGPVTCDHPSGSFFNVGDTLVTCSSRGSSTSFTVTVHDVTAPVPTLATLPTITGSCNVTVDAPTALDKCGGTISGTTNDPRSFDEAGTYTINWSYTDDSGNSASQTQTVVVTADTTPPVPDLATLPTVTDECSATVTETPTATDNCSGSDIFGTTSDPLSYTGAGTYTVHWTYTDSSGNSRQQNQTVVVTDTVAPTISLVGADPMTVECHTGFSDPGVTTTDNCQPKNVTVATSGSVNADVPGTYTVTYTATDGGGNHVSVHRTVIVVDTIKPVITLNSAASVTVECHTSYTDAGATASDACDTNVPVTTTGMVNVNTVGTYTLTYNATDDSGNAAIPVTRTVNVVDTTAPTITLNSYAPSMWPPNHKYTTFQLTQFVTGASDSCNISLGLTNVVIEKVTSDEIENGNGDGNTLNDIAIAANCQSVQLRSEREGDGNGRVYTITFKVTDASGNVGRATAKVVVSHNPGQTPVDSGVHYTVNGSCP